MTHIVGVSTFYMTAPIGHPRNPWFVNGVVAVDADSPSVASTRDLLRRVEGELGRRRGADPDAPRTIDLDLLLFEGELPVDRHIRERAFIAWPLAELAPQLEVAGQPIEMVAKALPRDDMIPLPELTATLRQRFAMDERKIERIVKELLLEIGEDPEREGLLKTPHRIAGALTFLTSGYRPDVKQMINGATFREEENHMIVVRDIEVYSLCAPPLHHDDRGVQQQNSMLTTSSVLGSFHSSHVTRSGFLTLIRHKP